MRWQQQLSLTTWIELWSREIPLHALKISIIYQYFDDSKLNWNSITVNNNQWKEKLGTRKKQRNACGTWKMKNMKWSDVLENQVKYGFFWILDSCWKLFFNNNFIRNILGGENVLKIENENMEGAHGSRNRKGRHKTHKIDSKKSGHV